MKKSILFAIAGVVVIFLTAGIYMVRHRLPPAEFAVIGYEDGTIRPLLCCCTRFSLGSFSVDCTFEDAGKIELLIHVIG